MSQRIIVHERCITSSLKSTRPDKVYHTRQNLITVCLTRLFPLPGSQKRKVLERLSQKEPQSIQEFPFLYRCTVQSSQILRQPFSKVSIQYFYKIEDISEISSYILCDDWTIINTCFDAPINLRPIISCKMKMVFGLC